MELGPDTPAVVTGASSGIGREVACRLARKRVPMVLVGRRMDVLAEVATKCKDEGSPNCTVVAGDIRHADSLGALRRVIRSELGGIRLLVHCAGLGRYDHAFQMDGNRVEEVLDTNLKASINLIGSLIPELLRAAPSTIAVVTSAAAYIPHRKGSVYCASKAGLSAYLACVWLELVNRGVKVVEIAPGVVDTPFFQDAGLDPDQDLPLLARLFVRHLSAGEVADKLVKAIERGRRLVVVPTTMRFFVAVRRFFPRLGDWVNRKLP